MNSESIANFCSITDAPDTTAEYFLNAAGGDLDMAIGLFYETGGSTGTNPNSGRNIHEISATISSNNNNNASEAIILTDSDSDGEIIIGNVEGGNQSDLSEVETETKPEDVIFNTGTSRRLADLFRPPHGIMFNGSFEMARRSAREKNRWLLVTIHAPVDFASQAMNRDLWNSSLLQSFIKENFVFVQMIVGGGEEKRYSSFYPYDGLYPHVALIDPRTGERVETLLVSSIPVPGFKLVPSDRDMIEILGEFIAEHSMDPLNGGKKRSSPPPIEDEIIEESKKTMISPFEEVRNIPSISPDYQGSNPIQIQFRLPSGQKHRHRFDPLSKLSDIFQTAAAVSKISVDQIKLGTAEGELKEEETFDISKLHNTMITIIK